jgi:hypothetical protein
MANTTSTPDSLSDATPLIAELKSWWEGENASFDDAVAGSGTTGGANGSDLWDAMPTIDSKTVATTVPIFERHLGIKLDVKRIKPGGYDNVDAMINHLVPLMQAAAHQRLARQEEARHE